MSEVVTPPKLKSPRIFLRDLLIFFPLYAVATLFLGAAFESPPPNFVLEALWSPRAISLAGQLSQFFGASMLAWELFHMQSATAALSWCAARSAELDQKKEGRNKNHPPSSARLLQVIGDERHSIESVKRKASEYSSVRTKMGIAGFFIVGVGALLQAIATGIA
jgi:hypothetical protein